MSTFVPASRVSRIKVSPSTAAAARARELKAAGRDIVDMTVGEPDFDTPDHVKAAAHAAIDRGETKYTAVNGTPSLRKAIIGNFERRLGLRYADNEICVGGGAKQILFLALMASVENDAEVIIPAPYWVSYPDMVIANEGKPVIVQCPQEQGFKLTPDALEAAITPKTMWLILNAPSNPTGAAYSRDELREIGKVLLRHPEIMILSDDIYDQVWFKDEPMTTLVAAVPELKERVLLTNGVSKSYAMTGWRIGYGAGPAPLIAAINKLQSQMSSCPSSVSQAAAAHALASDQGFVTDSVKVYRERRDYACRRLNAVPGLSCLVPDGAFYLFPNCAGVIGRRTPEGKVIETDFGTGKTETALSLADMLYGGSRYLTTINMSEFKEEHKISMLLGSPPGYVGYGEGGVLTEAVRRRPYGVLLLDEIDKAHPGVQEIFYQVFDKGTLRDGEGRDIDFKNTTIVMTANTGSEMIAALSADPDTMPEGEALEALLLPELQKHFKPAFLGRTMVMPFMPLGPETLSGIVDIQIGRIRERVGVTYGTALSLSPEARDALISRARTSEMGARAIEVMIARDLLPVLSTFFLDAVAAGKKMTGITIGYDGQRFGLDAEEAAPQKFDTPGESRLSDEVAPSRKRTRGAGRRKATTP